MISNGAPSSQEGKKRGDVFCIEKKNKKSEKPIPDGALKKKEESFCGPGLRKEKKKKKKGGCRGGGGKRKELPAVIVLRGGKQSRRKKGG